MDNTTSDNAAGQFLGEIHTQIADGRFQTADAAIGERLLLDREPNNRRDANAILVRNGETQVVGYLPRDVAGWLAPLLDGGKVRVEAYRDEGSHDAKSPDSRPALAILVFATAAGHDMFRRPLSEDRLHNLHAIALEAYDTAQALIDPGEIRSFAKAMQRLATQELLPESQLLLALIPGLAREAQAAVGLQSLATFRGCLESLAIGEPLCYGGLSVFPLFWPEADAPPYVLLSQAIENGTATVQEVSESGSVPTLRLTNKALRPLLVVEGEVLVGAKQNRVVNLTLLVAAKSTCELPVSCVEQGRWHYRSRSFAGGYYAPPTLRSAKLRSVQRNRRDHGGVRSDQGAVWDAVSAALAGQQVHSDTESLTDGLEKTRQRIAADRDRLSLSGDTAGVVVGRGERIVGMDLFDAPATFQAWWPRLAEAYLLDGDFGNSGKAELTDTTMVREFLTTVAGAARFIPQSLGLGEELAIEGDKVVGAALLYAHRVCHLAAFPQEGPVISATDR